MWRFASRSRLAAWYERTVFTPLMDAALGKPEIAALRGELLGRVKGRVVEVGLGTGLNLPHYARGVRVEGVVREAELDWRAIERAREGGVELVHVRGDAQAMPYDDASVRCIVCTFVLCSVADPGRALREFARVLADGGELLLLEHVRSPRKVERAFQSALTPLQRRLACGCHFDRELEPLCSAAGFDTSKLVRERTDALPSPAREVLRGVAVRSARAQRS